MNYYEEGNGVTYEKMQRSNIAQLEQIVKQGNPRPEIQKQNEKVLENTKTERDEYKTGSNVVHTENLK
jgi:hypothetical protein